MIILLVVAGLLAAGAAITVVASSLSRLDAASAALLELATLRREVTTLRDAIFTYEIDRAPQNLARVGEQSSFIRGDMPRRTVAMTGSSDRELVRQTDDHLIRVTDAARRLADAPGSATSGATRATLEKELFSQSTDVALTMDQLRRRAENRQVDEVSRVRATVFGSAGVIAILVLLALVPITMRIGGGFASLNDGLERFAAGDRSARIGLGGHDEFTDAAEGFNTMAVLVTEQERELGELNRRLLDSDRVRSEFIANMSHDLRTPLNSIIGFSGVLLSGMAGALDFEQTKQVGFINRSGLHLKSLVDDVLDLSRIEGVGWESRKRCFDLDAMVSDVIDTVRSLAAAKGVGLISDVDPAGVEVVADEIGCRRILMNLVGNAVKFTESGSVTIRARVGGGTLVLEVADTGPGIAEGDRARIFEPFEQAQPARPDSAKSEGSGLGLAIVRRIVGALDGTIAMHSEVGRGSIFVVTLPLEQAG